MLGPSHPPYLNISLLEQCFRLDFTSGVIKKMSLPNTTISYFTVIEWCTEAVLEVFRYPGTLPGRLMLDIDLSLTV